MLNLEEIIGRLVDPGIVAIVRSPHAVPVAAVVEALVAGGVTALEVTLTTPDALAAIAEARRLGGDRALVGVGTVLDAGACREAMAAGAQFIVSPICRTDLVTVAHGEGRPVMLGAYTPTEAQRAHEAGADFVKLFPADGLGPAYIKGLRGPLPHLRIVPTGGVDLNTVAGFIQAGCVAVGVGSSLISGRILKEQNWAELTRVASAFLQAVRAARAGKSGVPATLC